MKRGRIITDFTDFGNREWKDRLAGGNADNKKPEDFNPDDVAIGTAVEREHTNNPDIATEISLDHLSQDEEYYNKLIAAGIVDEEDALNLFDELKGKNEKEKSKQDILDYMNIEDTNFDEEIDYDEDGNDNYEEEIDYDEDELGSDKVDFDEDDELIIDDETKNNDNIMEKNILKSYKSFLKESTDQPTPSSNERAPKRMYSPENKSKVQIAYDESLLQGLEEHLLKESDDSVNPTPSSFIVLDFKDDFYKIVPEPVKGIRIIEDIEEQFYKDL